MSKLFPSIAIVVCAGSVAIGQTGEAKMEFEVASIKPLPPPRPGVRITGLQQGGPGTTDPTMYRCGNCSLGTLVVTAFKLRSGQYRLADWMWSQQFDLKANVWPGASREQFLAMLQGFLRSRFQLVCHFEQNEVPGYQMVVAKDGPRLRPAADDPPATPASAEIGKDGFPDQLGMFNMPIGHKLRMNKQTMSQLAIVLSGQTDLPVFDATGLPGAYDITLYWAANARPEPLTAGLDSASAPLSPEGGLPLPGALQSQLGLKLEQRKIAVSVLVIDHIEKTPTEN